MAKPTRARSPANSVRAWPLPGYRESRTCALSAWLVFTTYCAMLLPALPSFRAKCRRIRPKFQRIAKILAGIETRRVFLGAAVRRDVSGWGIVGNRGVITRRRRTTRAREGHQINWYNESPPDPYSTPLCWRWRAGQGNRREEEPKMRDTQAQRNRLSRFIEGAMRQDGGKRGLRHRWPYVFLKSCASSKFAQLYHTCTYTCTQPFMD